MVTASSYDSAATCFMERACMHAWLLPKVAFVLRVPLVSAGVVVRACGIGWDGQGDSQATWDALPAFQKILPFFIHSWSP